MTKLAIVVLARFRVDFLIQEIDHTFNHKKDKIKL